MSAFDRICKKSKPSIELMLVAGFSGIWKSVLVNEIHKSIVEKKAYFIVGKFDQFKIYILFSACLNAWAELIEQIFSESEAKLPSN